MLVLSILLILILLLIIYVWLFMRHERFGAKAFGSRLAAIQHSPNFKDGKFHNQNFTPDLKEGVGYATVMRDFFFNKSKRSRPAATLPSVKTNLLNLPVEENVLVWFGHSSYFMQVDGKKILVDPVFSGHASPVKFTTKSFRGADIYTADDLPNIDYLFISHDHWDHLDYPTIKALRPRIKEVVTGLGVGAHLERWGIAPEAIHELDWNDELELAPGFKVTGTPARHFSGRSFKRNEFLWMSFVLETPGMRIFIGGDSGYDNHFKQIGEKYGPFDIAILECGQYNEYWKYIHMMPEEVVQAARELGAKRFMPLHWGKFSLALHAWDEPIKRVTAEARRQNIPVVHAMIGERVSLSIDEVYSNWWEGID